MKQLMQFKERTRKEWKKTKENIDEEDKGIAKENSVTVFTKRFPKCQILLGLSFM